MERVKGHRGEVESQRDQDEIFFIVWLLNHVARAWGKSTSETYRLLESVGIVSGYLYPSYDVLHTMGREALVEDITLLARKRGLSV